LQSRCRTGRDGGAGSPRERSRPVGAGGTGACPCAGLRARTDRELVRGFVRGRRDCFEVLYGRHRERVLRYALARLGERAEAEDVAQEVFLRAHQGLAGFRGESDLGTWLFGIAHHVVCQRLRRRGPRPQRLEVGRADACAAAVPIERRLDAVRVLERLQGALEEHLTPPQRAAFLLCYAEGRSTRSIAEALGKSTAAVKTGLSRSRRLLSQRTPGLESALHS